jgi:hypothetical protein
VPAEAGKPQRRRPRRTRRYAAGRRSEHARRRRQIARRSRERVNNPGYWLNRMPLEDALKVAESHPVGNFGAAKELIK